MLEQPYSRDLKIAERVANRIGPKWSKVSTEDLTSHLYLWVLSNTKTITRWREDDGAEGKLYVALRREAGKFCADEHAAIVNRPIREGNFYEAALVARVLPFIFEDTPESLAVENPVTGQTSGWVGEYGRAAVIVMDVRSAFWGLNKEIRQVLEWRFRDGLKFEEIGELRGITKQGAKKQVDRGVSRLVDSLAGEVPF